MHILMGATGNIIKGNVLDVSRKPFEETLRDYDSQLYVVWNPKKLRGWGCWEIRRRPNEKTSVYKTSFDGHDLYQLEYVEYRDIHHVIDAAFLNYDVIRKLKSIDTWGNKNWVADLEARETKRQAEVKEAASKDLAYAIKQNKSVARDFYELVRSGVSPARILTATKWTQNS